MLPHYIWQDFIDVIDDLQSFGYEFEKEWYEVFLDFRFPFIGKVNIRDYEIELRTGIEPWIVLGEESTSIGTARYVDSSVERLQVKVSGLTDTRHTHMQRKNDSSAQFRDHG